MLLVGPLEMFEVLFERRFVELSEERGRDRGVEPLDVVDELTFVHVGFTFEKWLGTTHNVGLLAIG